VRLDSFRKGNTLLFRNLWGFFTRTPKNWTRLNEIHVRQGLIAYGLGVVLVIVIVLTLVGRLQENTFHAFAGGIFLFMDMVFLYYRFSYPNKQGYDTYFKFEDPIRFWFLTVVIGLFGFAMLLNGLGFLPVHTR
jgi:hypothetical protein